MNDAIHALRKEFRKSETARYIHRLHGVLLVLNGLSTVQAGKILSDPQRNIARWVTQFKEGGLEALHDRKKSGRPQALNARQQKALLNAISKQPARFGLKGGKWTGALVSTFLRKHEGVRLTVRHCRRLLMDARRRS